MLRFLFRISMKRDERIIENQLRSFVEYEANLNSIDFGCVSPLYVERRGEIARLLNEVDALSERLHDEFPTITEEDYKLFGPELKVVIGTLKSLLKESRTRHELKPYNERMREQILDLEELDHDIKEFRIDAPKNEELQAAMASVGEIDFSYLFK